MIRSVRSRRSRPPGQLPQQQSGVGTVPCDRDVVVVGVGASGESWVRRPVPTHRNDSEFSESEDDSTDVLRIPSDQHTPSDTTTPVQRPRQRQRPSPLQGTPYQKIQQTLSRKRPRQTSGALPARISTTSTRTFNPPSPTRVTNREAFGSPTPPRKTTVNRRAQPSPAGTSKPTLLKPFPHSFGIRTR